MTVFYIVAASLVAASLLFVIPPMLARRENTADVDRKAVNVSIYKNQLVELNDDLSNGDISEDQYEASKVEIERRLLEDAQKSEEGAETAADNSRSGLSKITALVLVVFIPVTSVLVYQSVGTPEAISPKAPSTAGGADSPHGNQQDMQMQIEMMVNKLAQRLEADPTDIEGWVMLGRSFNVLGRYDQAVAAFSKAVQFAGEDPNVLADYADALAMASPSESLEGKPMELLAQALKLDPMHQKSLWLMGTGMFESGDFAGAIEYWTRLQALLPPNTEDAQVMRANIQEARNNLALQGKAVPGDTAGQNNNATASQQQTQVAGLAQITGSVSLSPELAAKASANDTVFVYARAVSGPPMPLAIVRARVKDLPMEFALDESMAMMPNMSLAKFSEVVVGARVSKTGDAMPASGDMQTLTGAVSVGTKGLTLVIDSVVP